MLIAITRKIKFLCFELFVFVYIILDGTIKFANKTILCTKNVFIEFQVAAQ